MTKKEKTHATEMDQRLVVSRYLVDIAIHTKKLTNTKNYHLYLLKIQLGKFASLGVSTVLYFFQEHCSSIACKIMIYKFHINGSLFILFIHVLTATSTG